MFNQPSFDYTPFVEFVEPLFVREERLVEKQNRRSEARGLAATLTLAQWLEIGWGVAGSPSRPGTGAAIARGHCGARQRRGWSGFGVCIAALAGMWW